MEEDMKELNNTEDMAEDRKQWVQLISHPTLRSGKLGTLNKDGDEVSLLKSFDCPSCRIQL